MKQPTATEIRYEQMLGELARERFYTHPETAAEAIAAHYASHATMALQLLELIKLKRYAPPEASTTHADEAIEYLTNHIKRDHLNDFGIPLEWHNPSKH